MLVYPAHPEAGAVSGRPDKRLGYDFVGVPNGVVDDLPRLGLAILAIVAVVLRLRGQRKDWPRRTLEELGTMTGIKPETLRKVARGMERRGLLIRRRWVSQGDRVGHDWSSVIPGAPARRE